MRLSLHDKAGLGKKYVDEPELWLKTEDMVREVMTDGNINFEEVQGEAAFYGPKIDVQIWSAIGKEFTLATNQVDFAIPKRLKLTYKDKMGRDQIPLCIHRAPLGTHERFIGFLIEHFGGNFPLWLAPIQVNVIPVSDKNLVYAKEVRKKLFEEGIRSIVNEKSDKIGAKIRQAELDKNNIMLIVGDKEELNKTVSYRRRFDGNMGLRTFQELKNELLNEIKTRSLSHS
jgi:threonyl-tRNA synthetase